MESIEKLRPAGDVPMVMGSSTLKVLLVAVTLSEEVSASVAVIELPSTGLVKERPLKVAWPLADVVEYCGDGVRTKYESDTETVTAPEVSADPFSVTVTMGAGDIATDVATSLGCCAEKFIE